MQYKEADDPLCWFLLSLCLIHFLPFCIIYFVSSLLLEDPLAPYPYQIQQSERDL